MAVGAVADGAVPMQRRAAARPLARAAHGADRLVSTRTDATPTGGAGRRRPLRWCRRIPPPPPPPPTPPPHRVAPTTSRAARRAGWLPRRRRRPTPLTAMLATPAGARAAVGPTVAQRRRGAPSGTGTGDGGGRQVRPALSPVPRPRCATDGAVVAHRSPAGGRTRGSGQRHRPPPLLPPPPPVGTAPPPSGGGGD
ncbi:hypothetical protein BU14_0115s0026 [Porphyra umbilicalis]|uniref:Uncharacterized protein n=1 Tax=Porphyra umbilicalis TaxID=2786 RepID=A0A1X6PC19_PORUM|nr:hypothetical protein BU14_0115s0026 [Porphyra umbilicalis]|eukprot:OSX78255.1 hypothetical protein BU14_0115s0026 [Porphyra umbilicalis]